MKTLAIILGTFGAWFGFNLNGTLGAIVFGALCVGAIKLLFVISNDDHEMRSDREKFLDSVNDLTGRH